MSPILSWLASAGTMAAVLVASPIISVTDYFNITHIPYGSPRSCDLQKRLGSSGSGPCTWYKAEPEPQPICPELVDVRLSIGDNGEGMFEIVTAFDSCDPVPASDEAMREKYIGACPDFMAQLENKKQDAINNYHNSFSSTPDETTTPKETITQEIPDQAISYTRVFFSGFFVSLALVLSLCNGTVADARGRSAVRTNKFGSNFELDLALSMHTILMSIAALVALCLQLCMHPSSWRQNLQIFGFLTSGCLLPRAVLSLFVYRRKITDAIFAYRKKIIDVVSQTLLALQKAMAAALATAKEEWKTERVHHAAAVGTAIEARSPHKLLVIDLAAVAISTSATAVTFRFFGMTWAEAFQKVLVYLVIHTTIKLVKYIYLARHDIKHGGKAALAGLQVGLGAMKQNVAKDVVDSKRGERDAGDAMPTIVKSEIKATIKPTPITVEEMTVSEWEDDDSDTDYEIL